MQQDDLLHYQMNLTDPLSTSSANLGLKAHPRFDKTVPANVQLVCPDRVSCGLTSQGESVTDVPFTADSHGHVLRVFALGEPDTRLISGVRVALYNGCQDVTPDMALNNKYT